MAAVGGGEDLDDEFIAFIGLIICQFFLLCYWIPCTEGPWLVIQFLGNCFTWFSVREGDVNEYYRTSLFLQITYILWIH